VEGTCLGGLQRVCVCMYGYVCVCACVYVCVWLCRGLEGNKL